jgi:hypothetical protein
MKTYFDLLQSIQEATATKTKIAKPKASSAKAAAKSKVKAAPVKKPVRRVFVSDPISTPKIPATTASPYYPWANKSDIFTGWWHPSMQWFTFNGYFHVTKIVNQFPRFGITQDEVNAGLRKEAEYRYGGSKNLKITATDEEIQTIRTAIQRGSMDLAYYVQMVAYSKGWLKVYGGRLLSIEGTSSHSMKKAMDEILMAFDGEPPINLELTKVGNDPNTGWKRISVAANRWETVRNSL